MRKLAVLSLLLSIWLCFSGSTAFASNPYILARVRITHPLEVERLLSLNLDIVSGKRDCWVDVVARPHELSLLTEEGFSVEVLIPDMESYYAKRMSGKGDFGAYYTYAEANAIMDSIHAAHPDITTARTDLGTTWDGNQVWAMKVSDNPDVEEDEPELLYTGVHHAREPITCNICVELIRYLCDNYGSDPEITFLVDNRQMWFIPIVNPDGYLHNESTNPGGGGMWRKNRRDNGGGVYGVDNNRNYTYMWGYDNQGSSPNPSDETYRGPSPGSEPETQAVMNLCNGHEFVLALNYHSYSNLLLFPWGYDDYYTPDHPTFVALAQDMTASNGYAYGTPWELLYNTNGDANDWMYGSDTLKPKIFAFTPEVGEMFWQEDQIDQQIEENLPMNIYVAEAAGVYLVYDHHEIDDSGGNQNGKVDPGETVDMTAFIRNLCPLYGAQGVTAVLRTGDAWVELHNADANFGDIGPGSSGDNSSNPYSFSVDGACPSGHRVVFQLSIETVGGDFAATEEFNLIVGELPSIFFDDFESGTSKWIWDPPWGLTTSSSHSPTHSATDSPSGNYGSNVNVSMTMSTGVNLSTVVHADLTFYHHYEIEAGWDYGYVEISTNGGGSWIELGRYTGYQTSWTEENHSLDSYCGHPNVKIRYRLETDMWLREDGWYIDDVLIAGPSSPNQPPTAPTLNSPQDGDTLSTTTPTLVVNNALDPNGDPLTYGYRVYSDSLLTQLVASVDSVPEGPGTTSWVVDSPLSPNTSYWWRSYAADTLERGPSMETAWFTVGMVGIWETPVSNDQLPMTKSQLLQNRPNPFGVGGTTISFNVKRSTLNVSLKVYDLGGRLVRTLVNEARDPGCHMVSWDGRDSSGREVAAGVYFCRLSATDMDHQKHVQPPSRRTEADKSAAMHVSTKKMTVFR